MMLYCTIALDEATLPYLPGSMPVVEPGHVTERWPFVARVSTPALNT